MIATGSDRARHDGGARTPRDEVHRDGALRLYRYASPSGERRAGAMPVVLVYSLINRPSVLDLLPGRSVVASLIEAGHDVFLVDWGDPGPVEARLGLGGHLSRLARAVRAAAARAGSTDAALLGYCLGGTLALCLAALEPRLVRALGLLATPVVFEASGTFALWARACAVEPERFAMGRHGNVPGRLLRELLRWHDPLGTVRVATALVRRADDEAFAASLLAQERWGNDPVDFPGRLFATSIRDLYLEDRLARGTLDAGGRTVHLDRATMPIFNVVAAGDRIVPPESSRPLAALVGPGGRVETLEVPGGHIGMTIGRRAAETTHQALSRFFARTGGERS